MEASESAAGEPPNVTDGARRVLVAGIGNIFFGDDGFGVAVARKLARHPGRSGAQVRDYGIRGWDLAFALTEPWEHVILMDTTELGGKPGSIYLIEVDTKTGVGAGGIGAGVDSHHLDPSTVLDLARQLGAPERRMLIVGCEPHPICDASLGMRISPAVHAAVEEAAAMVKSLVDRLLTECRRRERANEGMP